MHVLKLQIFNGRKLELETTYEIGDYVGRPEACVIAGTRDTTLRRLIKDGQFPEPVPMSDGSHGFALKDVVGWRKSMDDRG